MQIFISIICLVAGFAMLVFCADMFVDGASRVAEKFKIPQIIIGLTIVAFGTSAPEAAVSITAGARGSADLAVANVLGSNIMNVLLILGITSVICPLAVKMNTIKYEIPFVAVITALMGVLGFIGHKIGWVDGTILWVFMLAFLAYLLISAKKGKGTEEEEEEKKPENIFITIIKIIAGAAGIVVGSNLAVRGASDIATVFGVSERIIGLTIVAFGTSLPELVTSIIAATKKKADLAIGNIVGSNIFNILFVLGTTALVTKGGVAYDPASCFLDNAVALGSALMLLLFVGLHRKKLLSRLGGAIMLATYAAYFIVILKQALGL